MGIFTTWLETLCTATQVPSLSWQSSTWPVCGSRDASGWGAGSEALADAPDDECTPRATTLAVAMCGCVGALLAFARLGIRAKRMATAWGFKCMVVYMWVPGCLQVATPMYKQACSWNWDLSIFVSCAVVCEGLWQTMSQSLLHWGVALLDLFRSCLGKPSFSPRICWSKVCNCVPRDHLNTQGLQFGGFGFLNKHGPACFLAGHYTACCDRTPHTMFGKAFGSEAHLAAYNTNLANGPPGERVIHLWNPGLDLAYVGGFVEKAFKETLYICCKPCKQLSE